MGKNKIDGVYDADPIKDPEAQKFDELTHIDAIKLRLEVMDSTALSLCMENKLPITVFDLQAPRSILQAIAGEPIGTRVST
jgi:uridylate kinase